jgi:hypothetical protein
VSLALALKKPLPKGTEYLIPVIEALAEKHKVSPYLLLGILNAESRYGLALKPALPSGSGDYIPRQATAERDAKMARSPLPGVEKKQVPGIKARGIDHPVMAWVPTTTGWGCGLFQLDYESHFDFCKSGDWADAQKAGEYAIAKILKPNRIFLAKKHGLTGHKLDHAMIASYNAGAGRVSKFITDGKDIDGCTFHPGYIAKICNEADALAGASGAFMSPNMG